MVVMGALPVSPYLRRPLYLILQMYLAPEVWYRVPHGLAVDMWATGVVTYELLHGMHPFW